MIYPFLCSEGSSALRQSRPDSQTLRHTPTSSGGGSGHWRSETLLYHTLGILQQNGRLHNINHNTKTLRKEQERTKIKAKIHTEFYFLRWILHIFSSCATRTHRILEIHLTRRSSRCHDRTQSAWGCTACSGT